MGGRVSDAVAINLRRPASITEAMTNLENALTAAELMCDQARQLSDELHRETNARHEAERQTKKLREENTALAKRVGELTIVNRADAETILAIAIRRQEVLAALRNAERITVTSRPEDYRAGETRRHFVTLDDAINDRMWVTLLAFMADVLCGGGIDLRAEDILR